MTASPLSTTSDVSSSTSPARRLVAPWGSDLILEVRADVGPGQGRQWSVAEGGGPLRGLRRGRRRGGTVGAALGLGLAVAAGLSAGGGGKAAHAAESAGLSLDYEIYFSGFHLASADIEVDLLPAAYAVGVDAESSGLIGVFAPWSTRAVSEGRRAGARLVPERHRVERPREDDVKITRMTFAEDGSVEVLVTPGDHTDGGGVPPELRRGALDPLTAAAGLIVQAAASGGEAAGVGPGACGRTVAIYDARRRYDAVVAGAVSDTLRPNRFAAYDGPAVRCTLRLDPVAGAFGNADGEEGAWRRDAEGAESRRGTVWLARPLADGPVLPVRIEAETRLGAMVVHLAGARAREPAIAERPAD